MNITNAKANDRRPANIDGLDLSAMTFDEVCLLVDSSASANPEGLSDLAGDGYAPEWIVDSEFQGLTAVTVHPRGHNLSVQGQLFF